MNVNKVGGGSVQPPVQQAVDPAVHHGNHALQGSNVSANGRQSGKFGGVDFRQGDPSMLPGGAAFQNRLRPRNMPISGQKSKQKSGSRSVGHGTHSSEESSVLLPSEERAKPYDGLGPAAIDFNGRDSGNQPDGETGEEKRFQNVKVASTLLTGKFATTSGNAIKMAGVASVPLPPMQSLAEVVKFLHTTLQSDPSGMLAKDMMRKIGQAVLRNEITLQTVRKASEARSLLVEVFGKGVQGGEPLSPLIRKLHVMLPLWLLGLGKTRTAPGKLQAAARLSLPNNALMKD